MIRTLTFAASLALLGFASSANAYPAADGVAAGRLCQPAGKILLVRHGAAIRPATIAADAAEAARVVVGHDDGPNHADL